MSDVTRILHAIEEGDAPAAEQLLPLVYDELRKLAAQKMVQESPGQTLQATALVHEAYLRLVDVKQAQHWDSRGHFFAAAAEAMRRILIDNARHKKAQIHGGNFCRVDLEENDLIANAEPDRLIAIVSRALGNRSWSASVAATLTCGNASKISCKGTLGRTACWMHRFQTQSPGSTR